MKRSKVNEAIRDMEYLLKIYNVALPPFCNCTPEEWDDHGMQWESVRSDMLGWLVTDFGLNKFEETGLVSVTLRNFRNENLSYAEKLMMLDDAQQIPLHYHKKKTEDIMNRFGGNVIIHLYDLKVNEGKSQALVQFVLDGKKMEMSSGSSIVLRPGSSITIFPNTLHDYEAEFGKGAVILGEVSNANDDINDNFFVDNLKLIPDIEEDERSYRYLIYEYPEYQNEERRIITKSREYGTDSLCKKSKL